MANDYISKVGLNITDWKTGISEIKRDNRVIESGFRSVSAGLDDWKKSADGLEARQDALNKKIQNQSKIVELLENEYKNVVTEYGATSKEAQNFEIKLNQEKEALARNQKELRQTETALDGLGDELRDTKGDVNKFDDSIEKSTGGLSKFKSGLASIGKGVATGVAAIGAAAVGAGAGLLSIAQSATDAGDRVDKMSQKMGLSRKGFQEWDYILSQNGASIDSMSTGFKTLTNMTDDLGRGLSTATYTFGELGMKYEDLQGLSQEEIFEKTITALQGVEDETKRAALSNDLFGKSGQALQPLLNQASGSIEEMKEKANELGLVLGDEAVDAAVDFADAQDSLKRSLTGFKNKIMGDMLPGFVMITDGLTGLVTGVEGAGEHIQEGAENIVKNIAETLPVLIDVLMSIASAIAEVLPDIFTALLDKVIELLPTIIQTIMGILPEIVDAVVSVIPMLIMAILPLLPDILKMIVQIALDVIKQIAVILPDIIDVIIKVVPELINAIVEMLPEIIEAGIMLFVALIEALPEIIETIVEALPEIITAIIDALTENIPLLVDAGIALFVALVEALPEIIIEILKAVPLIVSALVDAFLEKTQDIRDVGKQLITGIWEGIKNAADWLKEKIVGFAGNVVDWFKGAFNINSPSKEMMWIGEMIGQGLGKGIESSLAYAAEQASKMHDAITSSLSFGDSEINVNQSGNADKGNTYATQNVNQTINYLDRPMTLYEQILAQRKAIQQLASELM